MSVQLAPWEMPLLNWAYGALGGDHVSVSFRADDSTLAAAYRHCEAMTRAYSRTFYLASGLLPREKRLAVRALYAFCRITDNIVDEPGVHDRMATMDLWRSASLLGHPQLSGSVALAWADARARFNVPWGYADQLISGVTRDLVQTRYATFDDLAAYAYGVASTVGLMAMHIIGYRDEDAIPYAVKLGVALQLTNILRDVAEDWRAGRLYLPQEELAAYGLSESDIAGGCLTPRWRDFMRFQIARNRRLYDEARPGIGLLSADGRFAIAAAAELYRAILTDIERSDFDVFSRRARVGTMGKVRRLPGIWLKGQIPIA